MWAGSVFWKLKMGTMSLAFFFFYLNLRLDLMHYFNALESFINQNDVQLWLVKDRKAKD